MIARTWTRSILAGASLLGFLVKAAPAQTPVTSRKAASAPSMAAIVNGETITMAEVDAVLKMMPPTPKPPTDVQHNQMRQEALDMLTDDVLIRQYLAQTSSPISQAEIDKEWHMLKASLKGRSMTMEDFLRETCQTEAHLRQDIVKKLQWDKYVKKKATTEALKKYYQDNREFYDQVTVRASHILLRVSASASEAEKAQTRTRLQALREQIVAGSLDFAEAAKKYSQCQTAQSGGDIGSFLRKYVVDERIAKAAFAARVGEVTEIVETDLGLHLIKVSGRKPGRPSNFDAIQAEVRENFAMELWHDLLLKQRQLAKIENKMH
jgi:peptidyl-prolyl cis-trans isomerase C